MVIGFDEDASPACGSCRSRGSTERFHRSFENPSAGFPQLRQALFLTLISCHFSDLDQVALRQLPLMRVADRLGGHLDAVIAGHQHDVKLGLVESINSKIAALRIQARGYRNPEYFKLKIFQRCGLPNNPWAHIVL